MLKMTALAIAWCLAILIGGYAWGNHVDPDRNYCHFYPSACGYPQPTERPW